MRCGASVKRLDAPCRPDSGARRVGLGRPPAASKAFTVAPLRFQAFSWRIVPAQTDAGRGHGEKCGLGSNREMTRLYPAGRPHGIFDAAPGAVPADGC